MRTYLDSRGSIRCLPAIVSILLSVAVSAQKPKYFPMHKADPGVKGTGFSLNGLYVQKGATKNDVTRCAIFYSNGIFLSAIGVSNSFVNVADEQELMDALLRANDISHIYPAYFWGFYTMRHDTITTQMPEYPPGVFAWKSYEERWLVKGERMRKLNEKLQSFTMWERQPENKNPDTTAYVFHQWHIKPDSSLAWFFYKPWFQESLKVRGLK
jgi:hypothetical protein